MFTTDKKVVSYCYPWPKVEFGFLRCYKSFFFLESDGFISHPIQSKLFDLMKFNQLNELNRVKLGSGWVNLSSYILPVSNIKH